MNAKHDYLAICFLSVWVGLLPFVIPPQQADAATKPKVKKEKVCPEGFSAKKVQAGTPVYISVLLPNGKYQRTAINIPPYTQAICFPKGQ